ncbi:MAG TPA: hypothetical protein VFA41_07675 [Ktedonobacteraceae bacterium]|nr:hypothetical protein [Ktedonobacteraceae bacterium]
MPGRQLSSRLMRAAAQFCSVLAVERRQLALDILRLEGQKLVPLGWRSSYTALASVGYLVDQLKYPHQYGHHVVAGW